VLQCISSSVSGQYRAQSKVAAAHFEVPARGTSHSCRSARTTMCPLGYLHSLLQAVRRSREANSRSSLLVAAGHDVKRCINHHFEMEICPSTALSCRGNEIPQLQSIMLLTQKSLPKNCGVVRSRSRMYCCSRVATCEWNPLHTTIMRYSYNRSLPCSEWHEGACPYPLPMP
jgi:hypothetical protein